MNNRDFWGLMKETHEQSEGDTDRQAILLVSALVALGANAITTFNETSRKYVRLVMERSGFYYYDEQPNWEYILTIFASWLMGQGEDTYYQGLASLSAYHEDIDMADAFSGVPLYHVAPTAYLECTGQNHPDWIGFDEYLAAEAHRAGLHAIDAPMVAPDAGDPSALRGLARLGPFPDELQVSVKDYVDSFVFQAECLNMVIAEVWEGLPWWKRTTKAGVALAAVQIDVNGMVETAEALCPLYGDEPPCNPDATAGT